MKTLLVVVASAFCIASCTTIDHPRTDGSIVGRIVLFDSTQNVLDDFSGVRVSIDGTNKSTHTDATGYWEFTGLTDDTYDITATKDNFGTFHWYQQSVNGGRIDEVTAALAAMPAYTPTIREVRFNPVGIIDIYTDGNGELPDGVSIIGYCDLDSTVAPGEPHLAVANTVSWRPSKGTSFYYADLRAHGAQPGQTVYFSVANVFANALRGEYELAYNFKDPYHNFATRYSSNGPKSNVVSFVMP